jgi:hypothetical protein
MSLKQAPVIVQVANIIKTIEEQQIASSADTLKNTMQQIMQGTMTPITQSSP